MEKMKKQTIGGLAALMFVLSAALVIATSLMLEGAPPVAAAENTGTASISASISTVFSITVGTGPSWTGLTKNADNVEAGASFDITINSETNVVTDNVYFGGTDLTYGSYSIPVENIYVDNNTGGISGSENFALTDWTVENTQVPWIDDIPVPTTNVTKSSYFYISTAADQHAGDYTGTLYVKAVSS